VATSTVPRNSSGNSQRSCRSTCRDRGIAPRWRSPADSSTSPWHSSRRCPTRPTTRNTAAAREAERAAAAYEELLAKRPEAYADHAAAFYLGIGNRPQRAADLAWLNRQFRDTERSRSLLASALRATEEVA
jgi:hypothetical protein